MLARATNGQRLIVFQWNYSHGPLPVKSIYLQPHLWNV